MEVQSLSMYRVEEPARPGLVLGYGAVPTARIEGGLRRLRGCFDGQVDADRHDR